ncbi:MAG: C40 family peptidase [Lachnospiraceae bacterium]|nr:C40 family peptidase [Lachnospiraceae bacterium]
MYKKLLYIMISVALVTVLSTQNVLATSSAEINKEIEKAQKEKEKEQEELEKVQEEIGAMEEEQEEILGEMEELSLQIADIMASIGVLEEDIAAKEEEIEVAKVDLEAAIEKENAQYQDTKDRIQVMYESGTGSYLNVLLESDGLQDFLTRWEYVQMMYSYDNKMLADYQLAKEEVITLKENLEAEESELLAAKEECELEKEELEVSLDGLEEICEDYETQLAQVKKQAAAYEKKIKEQNQKIKNLEKQKKDAEQKENNGGQKHTGSAYEFDPAIIWAAEGSDAGKEVAVYAIQFLGNPYKMGGTSLTNGTDCSGFTQSVYANFGVSIPRTSTQQRSCGTSVAYENAQPGDLICYAGHVGMYVGAGYIVHASSAKTGIKISKATYRSILAVRRVL